MRLRLLTILALGCALAGLGGGCGGGAVEKDNPVERELADRFRVRQVPVRVSEAEGRTRKGVEVVPIEYPSTGGDRVTGYLARQVVPADEPAGVILLHGLRGGADDFLNEARELARRGALALTIDSPYVRSDDEKLREGKADLQPTYRAMELWVEDVLRGLDLLVERYGAAPSRLALVGYSMGAQPAALAAALDDRVAAVVLMAPLAFPSGLPDDLYARRLFTEIDTIEFVDNLAPTRLLLQGAEYDSLVPRHDLELLHERASEPKELRWYEADHELGQRAAVERVEWLGDQLGLR